MKVESERSGLVLGLVSYLTFDEAKNLLHLGDQKIVVLEESKSPKQDGIPPFNIYTIKVPDIDVEGFNGALMLFFFNNRLMEVRFYPIDIDGFALSVDGLSNSKSINIEPYTRAWLDKDYQGNSYIGWVDVRLQKQFYAWIKNYS
ncbi:MAG: hypothetical protein ABFS56_33555 [Pseudomonadota bacterium]